MSRRDASPFWSASAERQALKARRVETRKGLDAQLATRAEHAIAVSGQRPEMPLPSLLLYLSFVYLQLLARATTPRKRWTKKNAHRLMDLHAPGILRQVMKRSSVDRWTRTGCTVSTRRQTLANPHRKLLQVIVRRFHDRLQLEPDIGVGVGTVAMRLENGLHQLR